MAKSPTALVEPALLVWARERSRLLVEEVAERLKLTANRIEAWETGQEKLSVAQLRKLAKIYKRPIAVFFLPEPPRDFDALRDFRRVSGEQTEVSADLELDLRRAQELRESAVSLLNDPDETPNFPVSASLESDPEQVAEQLRKALQVTEADQASWRDSYKALRQWRFAVDSLGVLVVNTNRVEVSDARGFSIAEFPLPLIAINAKDSANGRVFTLMHELTHLALHEGGICEWSKERNLTQVNRRVETFCNRVAAAILLPKELITSTVGPRRSIWPDELLQQYSRSLSISEETFLRRLVTLNLATPEFYATKRAEYIQQYAKPAEKKSTPIVRYEKQIVGKLGATYLDLVFNAYYTKRITLSEVSEFTGVRVTNLTKVEREAFGMSRIPGDVS